MSAFLLRTTIEVLHVHVYENIKYKCEVTSIIKNDFAKDTSDVFIEVSPNFPIFIEYIKILQRNFGCFSNKSLVRF